LNQPQRNKCFDILKHILDDPSSYPLQKVNFRTHGNYIGGQGHCIYFSVSLPKLKLSIKWRNKWLCTFFNIRTKTKQTLTARSISLKIRIVVFHNYSNNTEVLVGNKLDAQFLLWYVYLNPLHVSSNTVLILRRTIVLIQRLV